MAEVIFRTKLKRLTNASHYALAEQIVNTIKKAFNVAGHMQRSLELATNAINAEKEYIYHVTDTNQSEELQAMIRQQNKYFTSISSILRNYMENPIDPAYARPAETLYSYYKAHMSKRGEKTLGDWIGSAKALIEIWSSNECVNLFDQIQLKNLFEKIRSKQTEINDFYAKYLTDVAQRGYSKSAYYRTNTDKYITIVCADLQVQTIDNDQNVAVMAEELIEGLNAMIKRFGGRRPGDNEEPVEEVVLEEGLPLSETASVDREVENEERTIEAMNSDQQALSSNNQTRIKDISTEYDNLTESEGEE